MPANNPKSKKKHNSTTTESTSDESTRSVQRPAWPVFEPLMPKEDLEFHHLVPGQILTVSNFWTSTLCKKYVAFLNTLPLTTTPGKPKKDEAVRVNDRFQIDDPVFAEYLWSSTALRHLVNSTTEDVHGTNLWGGQVIGLNPNIRIYRYRKGQYFDCHYDGSNTLTHPGPPAQPGRTTWTLLLYLTSPATGCIGGETAFFPDPPPGQKNKKQQQTPEPVVVSLETGMALLHRHGKNCMLHEGREVLEGEKWVIRSDLVVKA